MDQKHVPQENGKYKKVVEDRVKKHGKFTNDEYYITDEGLLVFTESYHINCGSCCGLRCRHCPFIPKFQKGNSIVSM